MMRALTVIEPGTVRLLDRPEPLAAEGEVLLAPDLVGVCGTDLDIISGDIDPQFVRYPITLGHEWTGLVVSVAGPAQGMGLAIGGRVTVEGIVPDGECAQCVAGNTNRCVTYDEFGFTRPGAAATLLRAPARLVHPMASGVSAESAALVEPASVVLRALTRARPSPGQHVLVVGDGTIGLLAARLIRLWSPATVTVLGLRPAQRELAAAAGVDEFLTQPSGLRFDLVVDAAGAVASVGAALAAVQRGGTVVLLGYVGAQAAVPMPVDDLINGDVTIVASFGYTSSTWRQVVGLLNAGTLDLGFLITHRFALADWAKALETLRGGDGPRAKVALVPGADR
jgi:2-desacetyl-2-hydroxyethyl bacteriochlorophyllide A dehydrogenase